MEQKYARNVSITGKQRNFKNMRVKSCDNLGISKLYIIVTLEKWKKGEGKKMLTISYN